MGAEGPIFTWIVASMAEQKVNLAAFGNHPANKNTFGHIKAQLGHRNEFGH